MSITLNWSLLFSSPGRLSVLAVSGLLFGVGCNQTSASPSVAADEPVIQEAPETARLLSPSDFSREFEASGGILLDVRTPEEVESSRLKGASTVNYRAADFETKVSRMNKTKPVFVYCASGGRSAKAAKALRKQGFENVYDLDGGILAWKRAGLPVIKGGARVEASSEFSVSPEQFDEILSSNKLVLADFHTPWCEPCRRMKPVVAEISKAWAGRAVVVKVDVDQSENLVERERVQGLPVLVVYRDGKEAWRHSGEVPAEKIEQALSGGSE